jgi:hypothetical protein
MPRANRVMKFSRQSLNSSSKLVVGDKGVEVSMGVVWASVARLYRHQLHMVSTGSVFHRQGRPFVLRVERLTGHERWTGCEADGASPHATGCL